MDSLDDFVRRSVSVSGEIVAHIETLISSGSLTPGTKLPPERDLARALKVSRVSLREAMHELEAKRVVDRSPGRGTTVLEAPPYTKPFLDCLSEADRTLHDVAELRATLEPTFAELAAARATEATIFALGRVLERSAGHLPPPESLAADITFHMLLAQASQNPLMVALLTVANQWTAAVREFSHRKASGRRSSHLGHQAIFVAVQAGDPPAARQAMLAHLAEVATLTRDAYPTF